MRCSLHHPWPSPSELETTASSGEPVSRAGADDRRFIAPEQLARAPSAGSRREASRPSVEGYRGDKAAEGEAWRRAPRVSVGEALRLAEACVA